MIANTVSCPAIKALVDALLIVGEATVLEDFEGNVFFDREEFYNRGRIMIDPIKDTFSIIVDMQLHEPYSFYDREDFMEREDFIGANNSPLKIFNLIVEQVNANKAFGTLYRVIERVS